MRVCKYTIVYIYTGLLLDSCFAVLNGNRLEFIDNCSYKTKDKVFTSMKVF